MRREGWDRRDGDEVAAQLEQRQEGAVEAEARENEAVGKLRRLARHFEALDRAKRVADVDDLVERPGHAGELLRASQLRQLLECRDLERRLDLVDGLAVRRLAHAQPVPRQRREPILAHGALDVRVVIAVERDVPIPPVEADAVREDLQCLGR